MRFRGLLIVIAYDFLFEITTQKHAQMKLKAEYLSSPQSELREILKVFPMGCMIERDV